ncbi:type III secretion system inner membrane ring subunit SctD [Acanthopleuribacter pedis]|uniref:Type III secretion system inner membrane ring subunit SctD n=1 Tax=Acanthopleuribacter pedis TaxID=442870 RepID=A0A8J7QDK8_9BACT|nr:type III secretion system inner membrane ring subunit SctD [Acanthopleuribacter pedis]MBO1322587.1 type III secretion system inner membrane ring subunit SctD [Acanthopleuribacter pedis]
MQNQLLLKIFSGPQVGAEIILNSGAYVMGIDDDCDLILHDQNMADKHLTLKLSGGQIFVRPFGQEVVMVGGERVTDPGETEVQPFSIITAGTTHFGLGPVDEKWPMFFLPDLINQDGGKQGIDPEAKTKEQPLDSEPDEDEELSEEEQAAQAAKKAKTKKRARLALALMFFFLAIFWFSRLFTPEPGDETVPIADLGTPSEKVIVILDRLAMNHLSLFQKTNRRLTLGGYVATQEEKLQLGRALRKEKVDVSFEVVAEDALVTSANEVLGIYSLNLGVRSLGAGNIEIHGFTEEADVLLKAVRTMLADISGIEAITNDVVTWPDLLDFFYKEMKKEDLLDVVKLELHGGKRLVVKGNLGPNQLESWDLVRQNYNEKYPELLEMREQFNEVTPVKPRKAKNSNKLALQIATVSVGSQRYITTAKGDKLFEGSRLPSGHIIKAIHSDKLILEFNGQEFEYQMGGGS